MRIAIDPLNLAKSRSQWSVRRWDAVDHSFLAMTFDDAVFQHASGEGAGYIEYDFTAPGASNAPLIVSARLSSEYAYGAGEKALPSEVVVSLNGQEIGRSRVIPDNARGQLCRWVVPAEKAGALKLKAGGNVIRFTVPASKDDANGLSIYSDAIGIGEIAVAPVTSAERLPIVIESAEMGVPPFTPPATDTAFDVRACARYRTLVNTIDGQTEDWCVFVPPGLEPGGKAGLIVYFHSMYGKGDTISLSSFVQLALRRNLVVLGVSRRMKRDEQPWPYIPLPTFFAAVEQAIALVREEFAIDPLRIYSLGSSMGGGPSLQFAATHDFIQAAAVIHGIEMDKAYRERLAAVPVLIFHGSADEPVPVTITTELETALNELRGTIKTVIRPGIRHEWRYLFNPAQTLEFFAQHQRRQASAGTAT